MVAFHMPPMGTWPITKACALPGNRTGDPLVHRPAFHLTEPHQPGYVFLFVCVVGWVFFLGGGLL